LFKTIYGRKILGLYYFGLHTHLMIQRQISTQIIRHIIYHYYISISKSEQLAVLCSVKCLGDIKECTKTVLLLCPRPGRIKRWCCL